MYTFGLNKRKIKIKINYLVLSFAQKSLNAFLFLNSTNSCSKNVFLVFGQKWENAHAMCKLDYIFLSADFSYLFKSDTGHKSLSHMRMISMLAQHFLLVFIIISLVSINRPHSLPYHFQICRKTKLYYTFKREKYSFSRSFYYKRYQEHLNSRTSSANF